MPQFREAKLNFLLELIEIDPNLLILASIIDHKDFGKLLKTFEGRTIKFPSLAEIKKIAKRASKFRFSLQKILKTNGKNTTLRHLAALGLTIDHKDVRQAAKAMITLTVFQEYIRSLYEDETFKFTIEEFENLEKEDKIRLYELNLQELAMRTNILRNVGNLVKRK